MKSCSAFAAVAPHRYGLASSSRQSWLLSGASIPMSRIRWPWISSVSPSITLARPATSPARAGTTTSPQANARRRWPRIGRFPGQGSPRHVKRIGRPPRSSARNYPPGSLPARRQQPGRRLVDRSRQDLGQSRAKAPREKIIRTRSSRSASDPRSRPCGRSRHWACEADARSASRGGRPAR